MVLIKLSGLRKSIMLLCADFELPPINTFQQLLEILMYNIPVEFALVFISFIAVAILILMEDHWG